MKKHFLIILCSLLLAVCLMFFIIPALGLIMLIGLAAGIVALVIASGESDYWEFKKNTKRITKLEELEEEIKKLKEEKLAPEEKEKLKTMMVTATDLAKLQREREETMNKKLSHLKDLNVKKGFLNPGAKLDYDIRRRMDSGKTKEQAVEEMYHEATT